MVQSGKRLVTTKFYTSQPKKEAGVGAIVLEKFLDAIVVVQRHDDRQVKLTIVAVTRKTHSFSANASQASNSGRVKDALWAVLMNR